MKISANTNQNINFKGVYNSVFLKKGLEFASKNGYLFSTTVSLALSMIARPAAIMATPKTDRENKKYACAKSIASGAVGYLITLFASSPVARAIGFIDENPGKYLKQKTIENLKNGAKTLEKSQRYKFAAQLFKLGLGMVVVVPKSALTCALIPPIMEKIFPDRKKTKKQIKISRTPLTFKGAYDSAAKNLAKGIGKIIDTPVVQKMSEKFSETNFTQHIISLTDIVATAAFVRQTAKSKKIEENRKKPLIYNSIISTALCLTAGYAINNALDKPAEKFIRKFKEINKNDLKLEKYLDGIKIAKPVLILGGIYYLIIPIIATFFADRADLQKKR